MRRTRASPIVALLLVAIPLLSCDAVSRLIEDVSALVNLSKKISGRFDEPSVSSTLTNGTVLTIKLVNSKRSSLPDQRREESSLEIARYAYSHFEQRGQLEKVTVIFVHHWSIIIFSYDDATDAFEFDGKDLAEWYQHKAM